MSSVLIVDDDTAILRAILDNRSGDPDVGSTWNFEILAGAMKRLDAVETLDLGKYGWEDFELAPLLAAEWTPPDEEDLPEGSEGAQPIRLTVSQRLIVDEAIARLRKDEED